MWRSSTGAAKVGPRASSCDLEGGDGCKAGCPLSLGIGLLKAGRDSGYGIKEASHCPSCSAEGGASPSCERKVIVVLLQSDPVRLKKKRSDFYIFVYLVLITGRQDGHENAPKARADPEP